MIQHRRDLPAPGPIVPDAAGNGAARLPVDRRPLAREPDAVLDAADRVGPGGARVGGALRPAVARGRRGSRRARPGCGAIPSSSSACAGGARTGRRRPGRGATTTPSTARCEFLDRSEQERDRPAGRAARRADPAAAAGLGHGRRAAGDASSSSAGRRSSRGAEARPRRGRTFGWPASAVDELLVVDRSRSGERRRRRAADGAVPAGAARAGQAVLRRVHQAAIRTNEDFLNEMANAHFRLGHINRMLDDPDDAAMRIPARDRAVRPPRARRIPRTPEYRQALAERLQLAGRNAAAVADKLRRGGAGLRQRARPADGVARESPANDAYQQELARTHYNRGILYGEHRRAGRSDVPPGGSGLSRGDPAARAAGAEAQANLQTLAGSGACLQQSRGAAVQARRTTEHVQEARPLYERAIRIHDDLTAKRARATANTSSSSPSSPTTSRSCCASWEALTWPRQHSSRALALLDDLVRPAPSLGIEQADAHNLRGRILQSEGVTGCRQGIPGLAAAVRGPREDS